MRNIFQYYIQPSMSRLKLFCLKLFQNFFRGLAHEYFPIDVQCPLNNFEIISDVVACEKNAETLSKLFQNNFITVRLHAMQRTVLLSQFCLSVCPSVCLSIRCVYCDKTKTVDISIPHEKTITLVF